MRVPKVQSLFVSGTKGMYKENSASGGWGPYLSPTDKVYDNVGDFLGTGLLQKYDVSISGGTEKFNSYASVAYMDNQGVVPKDFKKQLIKLGIQTVIAALTALLTALGVTACQ